MNFMNTVIFNTPHFLQILCFLYYDGQYPIIAQDIKFLFIQFIITFVHIRRNMCTIYILYNI